MGLDSTELVRVHHDGRPRVRASCLRKRAGEHCVPQTGCSRRPAEARSRGIPEVSRSGVNVETASRAARLSPLTPTSIEHSPARWMRPVTPTLACHSPALFFTSHDSWGG